MKRYACLLLLLGLFTGAANAQTFDVYTAMSAATECIDKNFFDAGYYDDDPERLQLLNEYLLEVGINVKFIQKEYDAMGEKYASQRVDEDRYKLYYRKCDIFVRRKGD